MHVKNAEKIQETISLGQYYSLEGKGRVPEAVALSRDRAGPDGDGFSGLRCSVRGRSLRVVSEGRETGPKAETHRRLP